MEIGENLITARECEKENDNDDDELCLINQCIWYQCNGAGT